jgi:hypothetical protein
MDYSTGIADHHVLDARSPKGGGFKGPALGASGTVLSSSKSGGAVGSAGTLSAWGTAAMVISILLAIKLHYRLSQ